jgi:hypothetical protein
MMPQHTWTARFYDDSRYLIEALNARWLDTVTARGVLRLENNELSVAIDDGA